VVDTEHPAPGKEVEGQLQLLADKPDVRAGNISAAPAAPDHGNQPLTRKDPQRLPQRAAAHPEAGGQLILRKPGAGSEGAVQHQLPDPLGELFVRRADRPDHGSFRSNHQIFVW